jgi:hypothetical protein
MRPIVLVPALLVAAACSGRALDVGPGQGGQSSGGAFDLHHDIVGGSGYFTVMSDGGAADGSYTATVVFNVGFPAPPITSITGCDIFQNFIEPKNFDDLLFGADRPEAGTVHIDGGNLALVMGIDSTGTYPEQDGSTLAWKGGEPLTISFPGPHASPGLEGGLSHTLTAPMYAALTPDSAFASAVHSVSRRDALLLKWQSDAAPAADDKIVVDLRRLRTDGFSWRALCRYDARLGQSGIGAAVLDTIGPGTATYAVTSEHDYGDFTNEWQLNYTLASHVRASDGPATGSFTIE